MPNIFWGHGAVDVNNNFGWITFLTPSMNHTGNSWTSTWWTSGALSTQPWLLLLPQSYWVLLPTVSDMYTIWQQYIVQYTWRPPPEIWFHCWAVRPRHASEPVPASASCTARRLVHIITSHYDLLDRTLHSLVWHTVNTTTQIGFCFTHSTASPVSLAMSLKHLPVKIIWELLVWYGIVEFNVPLDTV